jgi:hypothetical protein
MGKSDESDREAVRDREAAILVSSIIQGFTSHPPPPAALSVKGPPSVSLATLHTALTPLHFSRIRQVHQTGRSLFNAMPSTQSNYMLPVDPLSLSRIRSNLIRLEDTIIFCESERLK